MTVRNTTTARKSIGKRKKAAGRSSLGAQVIQGLREAVAYERGELPAVTVVPAPVTARRATATPAPDFDAAHVRRVRAKLKLSQPVFARALNVAPGTVRAWEQGVTTPSGPALRLLEIAERDPHVVLRSVHSR